MLLLYIYYAVPLSFTGQIQRKERNWENLRSSSVGGKLAAEPGRIGQRYPEAQSKAEKHSQI